jgi:hypothetical protein
MTTWFPFRTSASVSANPMPLPPPVMSTVFPEVFMRTSSAIAYNGDRVDLLHYGTIPHFILWYVHEMIIFSSDERRIPLNNRISEWIGGAWCQILIGDACILLITD